MKTIMRSRFNPCLPGWQALLLVFLCQTGTVQAETDAKIAQDDQSPTVEDVIGENTIDWPFYGRLVVLPPQNKTGDPELDWVSIAVQDAMTVDLWYVNAFETLALPQFSSIYKTPCPKLTLACVQLVKPETAIAALKDKAPSHIVQGTYHLDGGKFKISLQWETLNPILKLPEKGNSLSFASTLPKLTDALSQHLIDWLKDQGVSTSPAVQQRIHSTKTHDSTALKANAQGFWLQQRYGKTQDKKLEKIWEDNLKLAVNKDPAYAEAWNNLGWHHVYFEGSEHSKSIGAFSHSLDNKPALIDALMGQGTYAKKPELIVQAVSSNSSLVDHVNSLANRYTAQGAYAKAEPLYKRALAIREKVLGPEHPHTTTSLNNLAELYYKQGANAKAEPLFERALAIREKALGPEHPSTALSLNNLALLYKTQGGYAKAEPLYERALAIREKALGPDHPSTALSLNNLAVLYHQQGAYAKAEPLYERTLAINEKALGPDHPDTAQNLNNLAELYRTQGAYAKAEPLFERALAINENALDPDHPSTALSLNNLAVLYKTQGAYAKAEPLFERALAINEKALGPEHPHTASSLNNLAALYYDQGAYDKAEPLYERALAIREKALGSEHPSTADSLNNLAALYDDQDAYAKAEPLYKRALAIREKALGPGHPSTAGSLNNLALLYYEQGAYANAEPLYKQALAIREKALGPDHPSTATSLNNLAELYRTQGAYANAEPLYKQALAIYEKALGPEHRDTASSLNNLAFLYQTQGDYAKAKPMYERALAIREKALGPDHPDTAQSLNNLAFLYDKQGAYAKALPLSMRLIQQEVAQLTPLKAIKNQLNDVEEKNSYRRSSLTRRHLRTLSHVDKLSDVERASGFIALQLAHDPRNTQVMIKTALKLAGDDVEHKALLDAFQQALFRQQAADKRYLETLSLKGPVATDIQARARDTLQAEGKAVKKAFDAMTSQWQAFADLADPKPLSVEDTQALLRPGEAVLAYLTDENESYLVVVRKEGFHLHRLEVNADDLKIKVGTLRNAMEIDQQTKKPPLYDLNTAYKLYQDLLAPAESELKGIDHLIVVTDNALQGLPFAGLLSQPPASMPLVPTAEAAQQAYASAHWLIRDVSLSRLPSVKALEMIRRHGVDAPKAQEPFIGFGDPKLEGRPVDLSTTQVISVSDDLSGLISGAVQLLSDRLFRGEQDLASVEELNKLDPLPATGPELRNLAQAFKVDDTERLFLQQRASEQQLKELNKDGTLKKQQVIAFATHALQASEMGGIVESGLVFTPPEKPTKEDDGYLTAIEVSHLKLNADWVMLSACNTGTVTSNDKERGQSDNLSALAKSFFSAGSRNLLVTQWPVNDNAGGQLMSDLFSDPNAHKGKALQRAMLNMIDHGLTNKGCPANDWICRASSKLQGLKDEVSGNDKPAHPYSHPVYWAPYRILGAGG